MVKANAFKSNLFKRGRRRMPLLKEFDVQDDCLIVRLTGDLDHHETDAFREEWMTYLTNYPTNHVILSLKGVEFILFPCHDKNVSRPLLMADV
jgi:adenylate kinase family enzyme